MDEDLQTLLNYAMIPYFEISKYSTHIDNETFEKNKAAILNINGSVRKLHDKLKELKS